MSPSPRVMGVAALALACVGVCAAGDGVTARVDGTDKWVISPYLASMSLVYTWAPDEVYGNATYTNDTMRAWARQNHIATARYPAGTAAYWNWEDPSGVMGRSTLDPAFRDADRAPPHMWMSLSEYLDVCDATGITPLVGVNYNCHGNPYAPALNDSVAAAVRQVQYVAVTRGYRGAFWYIGNEDNAVGHAYRWAQHAKAMKAVDPTMKIFFNDNGLAPKALKKFLQDVAAQGEGLVDGAEFHGKWPFGGSPKLPPGTYDTWLQEVPLVEGKTRKTWRGRVVELRAAAAEAGYPDLLLANNEYGLGKPGVLEGFTRFTKAMVVVEFNLEMYVGGYDMAVFWDNHDGGHADHDDQMLLASAEGYRFNPMVLGFEMLAQCSNYTMLELTTDATRLHGFAARSNGRGKPYLWVYLMNKYETPRTVALNLQPGAALLDAGEAMVDTDDHWGARVGIDVACVAATRVCTFTIPPVSFASLRSAL